MSRDNSKTTGYFLRVFWKPLRRQLISAMRSEVIPAVAAISYQGILSGPSRVITSPKRIAGHSAVMGNNFFTSRTKAYAREAKLRGDNLETIEEVVASQEKLLDEIKAVRTEEQARLAIALARADDEEDPSTTY